MRAWLALWAARAAVERGLVGGPGADVGEWWRDTAPRLKRASGSALFDATPVAPGDARAVLDRAAVAADPGRLGVAWALLDGAAVAADPGRLGDAYAAADPGEGRRAAGRYYTPADLVARALDGVSVGGRVLDPACGGGRFLLGALARGAEVVCGADTDPLAVAVCRAALWLAGGRGDIRCGDPLLGLARRRVAGAEPPRQLALFDAAAADGRAGAGAPAARGDDGRADAGAPAARGDDGRAGAGAPAARGDDGRAGAGAPAARGDDGRSGAGAPAARGDDGRSGAGEAAGPAAAGAALDVLAAFGGPFDLVVGNPPYRAGRLGALAGNDALYRRAYTVAEYQLDPYPLFLELALAATRPGGAVVMVVPNAWMSVLRGGALRRLLLAHNGLERVVELPAEAFGAGVETVAVHVRRGGRTPDRVPIAGGAGGALVYDAAQPEAPLALARTTAAADLLDRASAWTTTLGDVAEVTRGINPYHRCMHTPAEIRARVHHAGKPGEGLAPELCGRDLGPYRLWWRGTRYVRYGPWLKEPRHPRFFDGPRLLVRKILGETLCAAYTEAPLYCDQSVYVARLLPGQPWPPGALLAFVNSRVVAALFRARCQEDDRLFPQIKVAELRDLPLPPVAPDAPAVAALAGRALRLQALEGAPRDGAAGGPHAGEAAALREAIEADVAALYGTGDRVIA